MWFIKIKDQDPYSMSYCVHKAMDKRIKGGEIKKKMVILSYVGKYAALFLFIVFHERLYLKKINVLLLYSVF